MKINRRNFLTQSAVLGMDLTFANSAIFANNNAKENQMITLNNGMSMPLLGYGVYQIPADICERCVLDALSVGYRSIDTAKYYRNEQQVGDAVKKSGIDRKDIFITSKIYSSGYNDSLRDIDDSVKKIGSYIDLMLIHWKIADDENTYRALEKAQADGKIKAIGISNYYGKDLQRIIQAAKIKPVLNQVECHIYYQQEKLRQFLQSSKMYLEAWSPFGGGGHSQELLSNKIIVQIAQKYHKTAAQIILRWLIQRHIIAIPKTTKKERMIENISIFDFSLTPQEMSQIATMDKNRSLFGWP